MSPSSPSPDEQFAFRHALFARMAGFPAPLKCLLWAILFAALALATTFENDLYITCDRNVISLQLQRGKVEAQASCGEIDGISIMTTRRMAGETGLGYLSIEAADGFSYKFNPVVAYIFGSDLAGNMLRGRSKPFVPTFGDWTQRDRSEPLTVTGARFQAPFSIHAGIYGRGTATLLLHTRNGDLSIDVSDGLLDNANHISDDKEALAGGDNKEWPLTNLFRIVNVWAQILCLAALLAMLFSLLGPAPAEPVRPDLSPVAARGVLAAILAAHFCAALYVSADILRSTPHISDAAGYYRMGLMMARGYLRLPYFDFTPIEAIQPNDSVLLHGNLYFIYPHFWPAILALAIKLGAVQILQPLLSCVYLWLVYRLTSILLDRQTAITASLLCAISPFTLLMAGDFMNHTATAVLLLGGLVMLLRARSDRRTYVPIVAGLLSGYAFDMRTITAAAFLLPVVAMFALWFPRHQRMRTLPLYLLAFAAMASLTLLDNRLLTGSAVVSPYQTYHHLKLGPDLFLAGMNSTDSILAALPAIIFYGVHPMLFPALACSAFFLTNTRKLLFLVAIFLMLQCSCILTYRSGLHGYGPRYLFEGTFVLFMLAAMTIHAVLGRMGGLRRATMMALVAALVCHDLYGLAKVLPFYRNYGGVDTRVLDKLRAMDLSSKIILTTNIDWRSYGITVTLFDPDYVSSVFLKRLPNDAQRALYTRFPGREIYQIEGTEVRDTGERS